MCFVSCPPSVTSLWVVVILQAVVTENWNFSLLGYLYLYLYLYSDKYHFLVNWNFSLLGYLYLYLYLYSDKYHFLIIHLEEELGCYQAEWQHWEANCSPSGCPAGLLAQLSSQAHQDEPSPGPLVTKKTPSYQYRDSRYKPETVYNGGNYLFMLALKLIHASGTYIHRQRVYDIKPCQYVSHQSAYFTFTLRKYFWIE